MTDNTHTDNEEPDEGDALGTALRVLYVHGYHQGYADHDTGRECNSNKNKDHYVAEAYRQIRRSAPTKSSGELEEILKIIDQYSIHKPRGQAKGTLARRELKKRIQKLHTTQTTKLQAEARLDELKGLHIGAYHAPFNSPETNYDEIVKRRISELEAEIKG